MSSPNCSGAAYPLVPKAVVSAKVGAAAQDKIFFFMKDNCDVEIYRMQRAPEDYTPAAPVLKYDLSVEGNATGERVVLPGVYLDGKPGSCEVEYDAEQQATKLTALSTDPNTYLNISVPSEYRFMRIEVMMQAKDAATTMNFFTYDANNHLAGQITTGSIFGDKQGQWVTLVVPMGCAYDLPGYQTGKPGSGAINANAWNGHIVQIRFDFVDALATAGDTVWVRSIDFFATEEEANAYGTEYAGTVAVDKTTVTADGVSAAYVKATVAGALTDSAWVAVVPANVANPTPADIVDGVWARVNGTDGEVELDVGALYAGNYKIALFDTTSAMTASVVSETFKLDSTKKEVVPAVAPTAFYNAYVEAQSHTTEVDGEEVELKDHLYINSAMTTNMTFVVNEDDSTVVFTLTAPFNDPEAYTGEANFVLKGLAIETAKVGAFVIRYKLNSGTTSGEMFWRGKNADGSDTPNNGYAQGGDPYAFEWDNSGEWVYTVVDMSEWSKLSNSEKMDLLRFDFNDGSAPDDVFELDYIAFFPNVDLAKAFIGSDEEAKLPKLNAEQPPESTETTETTPPESTPETDEVTGDVTTTPPTTPGTTPVPPTGNYAIVAFAVIAVIALGGFVVVKKVRA